MRSLGLWHLDVPRDLEANLEFRKRILDAARKDRSLQLGLIEICRKDVLFWINTFVWTYNPNAPEGREIVPFITWPVQDRAVHRILRCIEERRDGAAEKSREMGASWLFLLIIKWGTDFQENKKFLLVSRDKDSVDRPEDPDSLMWKLDFVQEYLPNWLVDKEKCKRRALGYTNTETNGRITGQASTGKAGVGGRCTAMFVDEWTQIDADREIYYRTSDTTKCRLFNFTHLGLGTAAYELMQLVNKGLSKTVKIQLHWTQHPDKNKGLYSWDVEEKKIRFWKYVEDRDDIVEIPAPEFEYDRDFEFDMTGHPLGGPRPGIRSPWYDDQCQRKGSSQAVAMDLDIDPQGSVSQFFDPILIHNLKMGYCRQHDFEGHLDYDDFGQPVRFVEAKDGPIRLWVKLNQHGKPPEAPYGAGADVSGGTGRTPSCLSIANAKTGEKALEFYSAYIEPRDFATLAVALCRMFYGAKIAWEHGGPGVNFGLRVIELGHTAVYRRRSENKIGQPRSDTIGWSPLLMPQMLREYAGALKRREFLNYSARALDECLSFVHDGKGGVYHAGAETHDPAAARANHGDLVVADGLANKMVAELGYLQSALQKKHEEEKPKINPCSLEYRMKLHEREREFEEAWY